MADNRRNNRENNNGNNPDEGQGWWGAIAAGAALIAAGAGLYLSSRKNSPEGTSGGGASSQSNRTPPSDTRSNGSNASVGREVTPSTFQRSRRGVPRGKIPDSPEINNINALLHDIYVRYIALKDDDFEMYYNIFTDIFGQIHKKMKKVDPYFARYSSNVVVAGSHYDRLRINKPDEFDVDIVIGLPLNMKEHRNNPKDSDIILEPKEAGFVQLRMGTQYKQFMMRDGWEINKAAYKWSDGQEFLLRSNFTDWFKGVVDKALNSFNCGVAPVIYSGGVPYTIRQSESGPAKTLFIENRSKGFKLDVDLVPALKFPEERWPITNSYREI
ncbi:uncharacterized protein LOC113233993, partial [Hyposmocoma kahamanoa]|uniref:uncharacterized protein LOC113233993 n=1 Tax=Hyposmocoma kahamanoa TaxID=1477025 RepID=UPI000E6D7071